MTSCKSAVSSISKLWKGYKDIASALGCGAVGVLESPQAAIECLETTNKIKEAVERINKKYQNLVGKTSPGTIGPRLLRLNTWEKGSIPSTFGRVFTTAVPMSKDIVSITIEELGGKGKVGIAVCAIDENGRDDKLTEFVLNENAKEKENKSQRITRTLKGVKGKWIVVHLDGKSVANNFQYKLFLDA